MSVHSLSWTSDSREVISPHLIWGFYLLPLTKALLLLVFGDFTFNVYYDKINLKQLIQISVQNKTTLKTILVFQHENEREKE